MRTDAEFWKDPRELDVLMALAGNVKGKHLRRLNGRFGVEFFPKK